MRRSVDKICAGSPCAQARNPVGLPRFGQGRQGDGAAHPGCADATSTQGHAPSGAAPPQLPAQDEDVLLVYQLSSVALQNEAVLTGAPQPLVITVSVDEKPGVQAIGNTAPDLPPVARKHSTVAAIPSTSAMPLGRSWQR
jgi:hypothetical protein